jgi:acyl dehydratase
MDEYYEDLTVGDAYEFGSYRMTREEIVEFARQYDPQPFHTDEEAARASIFGGLVASGWHTGSVTMRLLVDNYLQESGALGSPGLESLRWTDPVRPGDELSVRTEVAGREPWDGDRGVGRMEVTTVAGDERPVMTMTALVLYPRR